MANEKDYKFSETAAELILLASGSRQHDRYKHSHIISEYFWREPAHELQYMSSPTKTTSVFWPNGSTKSGVCYGWLKPAICIAGVVDVCTCFVFITGTNSNSSQDLADPDALATTLSQSAVWVSVKASCRGNPTLLGTCTFNPNKCSPVPSALKLWGQGEGAFRFSFVLYCPHAPQSLRFYVIDPPENSPARSHASPLCDPYNDLARYDFTRPGCRHVDQALNDVVINQVSYYVSLSLSFHELYIFQLNASFLVQTLVNSSSRKTPKLLPTTASLILAFASHLGVLSSFFLVLSKIAATFTSLSLPIPTLLIESPSKTSRCYFRLKDISATGSCIFPFIPSFAHESSSAASRRQNRAGCLLHHTGYNAAKAKHS